MGVGFLFMTFCMVFVLGCEKRTQSSSQGTETDANSEDTVTEKPPAPVNSTSVKPAELTLSSSQETEMDVNSEGTVTEKPPAPASATPVKPKVLTFELVKGIKFADGTEVKSITKADIDALRDRPISMGGNNTDGARLNLGYNARRLNLGYDEEVYVRTCREYDTALERGYGPDSTYDIAMASWFKYPCEILNLLETATIPQQSFLPTSKEEVFNLKLIPLSLFPILTDFEQAYGYKIWNVTYQDRADQDLLKVMESDNNSLICEDDGLRQHLTEEARADFNSDGIEDILLSEAVHATQGTYRTYDLIILTRKSMDGKYEKIKPHDPK